MEEHDELHLSYGYLSFDFRIFFLILVSDAPHASFLVFCVALSLQRLEMFA